MSAACAMSMRSWNVALPPDNRRTTQSSSLLTPSNSTNPVDNGCATTDMSASVLWTDDADAGGACGHHCDGAEARVDGVEVGGEEAKFVDSSLREEEVPEVGPALIRRDNSHAVQRLSRRVGGQLDSDAGLGGGSGAAASAVAAAQLHHRLLLPRHHVRRQRPGRHLQVRDSRRHHEACRDARERAAGVGGAASADPQRHPVHKLVDRQ
eukprot:3003401-Rhodomonas_salina.1